MVIDKTTGKGCAWSIASKTITRHLIANGIIGQPIFKKPHKNGCDLVTVSEYGGDCIYVHLKRGETLAEGALWTPSFIDTEIWTRAVSRFRIYTSLERNVEKYLIPEMDEYLQNISDAELVAMTREFLIENGVIHKPIRQNLGDTYYFNEKEIYSIDKGSELFPYDTRMNFYLFKITSQTCFNLNVWYKAASQFETGMTLEDCIGIFLKTELVHQTPQTQSSFDRLVQSVGRPVYERTPENLDTSTFDRIRVTMGLSRYQFHSWGALRNEVEKHRREIYRRGVQKIEADRSFKKYGVPLNYIKLSNAVLLRNFSIELIFELKEPDFSTLEKRTSTQKADDGGITDAGK